MFFLMTLGLSLIQAQIFPSFLPINRSATGLYSLRNLALGETRFTNADLYNLYDQGGSPLGLLETHQERLGAGLGLLGNIRATNGDSLEIGHHDYYIPQLSFFQPGVFGAILYFQQESENYQMKGGDSVESSATRFGLDLAAGSASGLFRIGFSAHAKLGDMNFSGDPKRVVLEVPALRFDLGSRFHPAFEVDLFIGVGGHFDSLEAKNGRLERVATMTLPRYGIAADMGGTKEFPFIGNAILEFGKERSFGEYKEVNGIGTQYPITWTDYWSLQTQWMYPVELQDFRVQPALRFAYRSAESQSYQGIKGNQNPFKTGDKIINLHQTRSINSFGLGGNASYLEMLTLMMEWETAGHNYKIDSSNFERYYRFSMGLEQKVERLSFIHFHEGISLALRMGWAWTEDAKSRPGYEDYQFDPFVSSSQISSRLSPFNLSIDKPEKPAAYRAFSLGFGLGLLKGSLTLDGLLSFPSQLEKLKPNRTQEATGTEIGLLISYRMF